MATLTAVDGIRRADGEVPFNHYLWPTESWWLNEHLKNADGRWHFGIIALADGRFATEGSVFSIADNKGIYGGPCVFADRVTAIRTAAARILRTMRGSRNWSWAYGGMQGATLAAAINWTLATVARETAAPTPRTVHVAEPMPPRPTTGLELFDFAAA